MIHDKHKKETNPRQQLTEWEDKFYNELKNFKQVLAVAMLISLNQHGISTDGRGVRSSKIFTRLTQIGINFKKILPHPLENNSAEINLWDICSIASLTRNIIEGFLALNYYGTEKISKEEAELRFLLLQLHRNREWLDLRKLSNDKESILEEFKILIKEQEQKIKNHPFFSKLTSIQKNKALNGQVYKTKADFEKTNQVCISLKRDYQLLSNLVHPLPLSVERINNIHGRGLNSLNDVLYCFLCLSLARQYLAASAIAMADYFPDHLSNKFKFEVDAIRPMQFAD